MDTTDPEPLNQRSSKRVFILAGISASVFFLALFLITYCQRKNMASNESQAIAACKAFATAEDLYRRVDRDGDGVLEYSSTLRGLYQAGVLNPDFAAAEGPKGIPYHGYLFKVLTKQGPKAPSGTKNYIVNGNMTVGYALVAWPYEWNATGRNSFQVSTSGTVYQRDTGGRAWNGTGEPWECEEFDPPVWSHGEE